MNPHNTTQTRVRLIICEPPKALQNLKGWPPEYNTVCVKRKIGAVHHSHRIRIHDLMNSVRASLRNKWIRLGWKAASRGNRPTVGGAARTIGFVAPSKIRAGGFWGYAP